MYVKYVRLKCGHVTARCFRRRHWYEGERPRPIRPKIGRAENSRARARALAVDTSVIFTAPRTGSLRRLSLDISSVPGIAAPPRRRAATCWLQTERHGGTVASCPSRNRARFPVSCGIVLLGRSHPGLLYLHVSRAWRARNTPRIGFRALEHPVAENGTTAASTPRVHRE